jgi:hypothetical protein
MCNVYGIYSVDLFLHHAKLTPGNRAINRSRYFNKSVSPTTMMFEEIEQLHSPQAVNISKTCRLTTMTKRGQAQAKFNTQCRLFQMLQQVNVIDRHIAGGKGAPLQITLEKIRLSTGDF